MAIDRGKCDEGLFFDVQYVDQSTLFETSDVISLYCSLTAETEGLINANSIKQMKRTAILINTSRGGLVVDRILRPH